MRKIAGNYCACAFELAICGLGLIHAFFHSGMNREQKLETHLLQTISSRRRSKASGSNSCRVRQLY
jgi:hypothetical protein